MEEDESNSEVDSNASRQRDGGSSMNDPASNFTKQDSDDSCGETPARSKRRVRRFTNSDSKNGGNVESSMADPASNFTKQDSDDSCGETPARSKHCVRRFADSDSKNGGNEGSSMNDPASNLTKQDSDDSCGVTLARSKHHAGRFTNSDSKNGGNEESSMGDPASNFTKQDSDDSCGETPAQSKHRVGQFADSDSNNEENQGSSINNPASNLTKQDSDDSCGETPARSKHRVGRFADSDSENGGNEVNDLVLSENDAKSPVTTTKMDSDDSSDTKIFNKSGLQKSRIRKMSSSGSDSDEGESCEASSKLAFNKNEEQQSRMKNKRNKLRQRFESLVSSRGKEVESMNVSDKQIETELNVNRDGDSSDTADEEAASIEIIKQKIKERTMHLKTTIYDPDTSDEESNPPKEIQKHKQSRKSTKLTSPKPMRMSAKQAMENMQKIKSESNRMLREKEVSLPYHRPKALSLKDIMSRRRPAVTPDGKALPIKMNEEQLKQYVTLLEQRQKEMIELCKSDTDEETPDNDKPEGMLPNINSNSDTLYNDLAKNIPDGIPCKVTCNSDELYDDLAKNKPEGIPCKVTSNSDELYDDLAKNIPDGAPGNVSSNSDELHDDLVKANTEGNKPDANSGNNIDVNPEINRSAKEYPSTAENVLTGIDLTDLSKDLSPNKPITADVNDINSNENATSGNISTEIKLVYADNDSIETINTAFDISEAAVHDGAEVIKYSKMNQDSIPQETHKCNTNSDSQLISLHYDSEKIKGDTEKTDQNDEFEKSEFTAIVAEKVQINEDKYIGFSDDDINMEDIDTLIENAEIIRNNGNGDNLDSPMLIREQLHLRTKPKLMGTPGMVIDLDGTDPFAPKKLTGVELLKERFKYFSKFKTKEEMEREREKIIKPGTQHLKLKQALEEEMTEQRSLEWTKRLEEAKLQQIEMDAIRGDTSDAEDDIEKIEVKSKKNDEEKIVKESSSENEEEEEQEDISVLKEKPRIRNPMISDEAEESDCDEFEDREANNDDNGEEAIDNGNEADAENDENDDDESVEESSEEESESEDEQQSKPKKGRILKAFEDSDDESTSTKVDNLEMIENNVKSTEKYPASNNLTTENNSNDRAIKDTQDDEIQLAQLHKSLSEDIFASQDSALVVSVSKAKDINTSGDDKDLGTQTFSILNSEVPKQDHVEVDMHLPDKLTIVCASQPYDDNLDAVVGMCSGSFSQNLVTLQFTSTETQSQAIGEDVLALCTGKFYDNQFISQIDNDMINDISQQDTANKVTLHGDLDVNNDNIDGKVPLNDIGEVDTYDTDNDINRNAKINDITEKPIVTPQLSPKNLAESSIKTVENVVLRSILDEVNDPIIDSPKQYKYFVGSHNENKVNTPPVANGQLKKRFVIDSDDEDVEKNEEMASEKRKFKKKKLEKRALQISDDEDDDQLEDEEVEDYTSEKEDDNERLIEYDSEENEVEVKAHNPKKKRKTLDFFEQEAELTSEDEWVGSGDEDEAGLDRMEREVGDDDTFNQGELQRELGQIHMRDVLDQDKREVRLIQELLFEDGDLGVGGRQRKFRWVNADGEEATGTIPDELADTQEEEFESEELWRKQRHERYTFLKEMEKQDKPEEALNVSVNRTSIIKANLCSRTMSSLLEETNTVQETVDSPAPEKKTAKDVPSPKKPFALFQQNYHGSLLARGRGALARLAALASPIASEDDSPKLGSLAPSSKRNFVFATLTPEQPKITKRKADENVGENAGTPRLVKKLKTEEKRTYRKGGLLDHMKA